MFEDWWFGEYYLYLCRTIDYIEKSLIDFKTYNISNCMDEQSPHEKDLFQKLKILNFRKHRIEETKMEYMENKMTEQLPTLEQIKQVLKDAAIEFNLESNSSEEELDMQAIGLRNVIKKSNKMYKAIGGNAGRDMMEYITFRVEHAEELAKEREEECQNE